MKLLTKENLKSLPAIGSQKDNLNPIAHVKLFAPWGNWTWYIMEYDPKTEECFGLVQGFETELGYFSLAELAEIRGMGGLKIKRDRWFQPKPLKNLSQKY